MRIPKEGCWRDDDGVVYRHATDGSHKCAFNHKCAFERWIGVFWYGINHVGTGPWTTCEDPSLDRAQRDMCPEVRQWMVDNPGRVLVTENGSCLRWNDRVLQFEAFCGSWRSTAAMDGAWSPLVPEEGGW